MDFLKRGLLCLVFVLLSHSMAYGIQGSNAAAWLDSLERVRGACSFAVIGDSRSGNETYARLIRMIMERKPNFVVNVGDQINRPGSLSDWKLFWDLSTPITVPYFLTVGNHDVDGGESEEIYRQQVDLPGNELYYSFCCGDALLVVLNSHLTGQQRKIAGPQLDWLAGILEGSGKRHKFVFLHHPLYVERIVFSGSLAGNRGARDRLRELLVRNKVGAVFAGHLHLYERREYAGLLQIITGGGGASLIADEDKGGFFHFVYLTVDGDTVRGEVIDLDGRVRDRFSIP